MLMKCTILLLIGLSLLAQSNPVLGANHARLCALGPQAALRESDVVFSGTVTEINLIGREADNKAKLSFGFDVSAIWKGMQKDHIRVYGPQDIQGLFKVGEEYLVYAEARADSIVVTHPTCRTTSFALGLIDRYLLGDPMVLNGPAQVYSPSLSQMLDIYVNEYPVMVVPAIASDFRWLSDEADTIIDALLEILESGEPDPQGAAARALGEFGLSAKRTVPALERTLRTGATRAQTGAMRSLLRVQPPLDAARSVSIALDDEDGGLRQSAYGSLAQLALKNLGNEVLVDFVLRTFDEHIGVESNEVTRGMVATRRDQIAGARSN